MYTIRAFFLAFLAAVSVQLVAAEAEPAAVKASQKGAAETVAATTERVMTLIDEAQDYYDEDPERFYGEIELILDEVVDFNSFARGVMGRYASKKYYMSLSDADKKAFRGRVTRFSNTFKDGLVQTYAKGLLAFGGTRIEVEPLSEGDKSKSGVTVLQKIYGDAEQPYQVHYKMRLDKHGSWKLRNLTIEAVNLGKVYQGQFSSAVKQYEGDIDKVIDNWSVDPRADAENDEVADSGTAG